jgi:benzylsuccinate CoA-transferase BbsE subunit
MVLPRGEGNALEDVRVLDLTGELGVYCAKLLADLGADVIRVEPPDGDPIRRRGPFVHDRPGPDSGILHIYYNTSKRCVTLNLESGDGRALFRRLLERADIVVESFLPGYLASLGLGYEEMTKVRPDLILTSVTGFGQTGPHAAYEAPDIVGVAMSGIMTLAGFPDAPPYRPYPSQGYFCAGLEGAIGTLVALTHRDLHGEGQWVDVSMQEALSMAQETAMQYWDFQKLVRRRTGGSLRIGLYGLHPCKDGYVFSMVGVGGAGSSMAEFVRWLDQEGFAGDLVESGVLAQLEEAARLPRGDPGAVQRQLAMREQVGKVMEAAKIFFLSKTKQELYEQGQAHGFLLGPVNDPKDLVESPQLAARQWYEELPHPALGMSLKMPGVPYALTASPARLRRSAPQLGEHNVEVYCGELGLTRAELTAYREAGVI